MTVSDEAVEAAITAVYGGSHLDGGLRRDTWRIDFRAALEAAMPHILGDAWIAQQSFNAVNDQTWRNGK